MKNVSFLVFTLLLFNSAFAQPSIFRIPNDSILAKSELILENSTKGRTGAFIRNRVNGRTDFAYAVDSIYTGHDTMFFHRGDGWKFMKIPSSYTDAAARAANAGLYPSLSVSYVNPSWIASLPASKITGLPPLSGVNMSGTIAELRAMSTSIGQTYSSTDRPGQWVDSGLADGAYADDGALYIITANNHLLKRVFSGPLYIEWFGAKPGTNSTAAIKSALVAAQKYGINTVTAGDGEFIVDSIRTPYNANINFVGNGHGTIFRAGTPNTPLFQVSFAPPGVLGVRIEGVTIGNFAVKAHPSGSTTAAVEMFGYCASAFTNIRYYSNGSGNFRDHIELSAPVLNGCFYPCYSNEVYRPYVQETTLTGAAVKFTNKGLGVFNNANSNSVINAWIYNNPFLTYGVDAYESTEVTVSKGGIEVNPLATSVAPGQSCVVEYVWLENNHDDFVFRIDGSIVPNNGTFKHNYFSNTHIITFPVEVQGNSFFLNGGNIPKLSDEIRNHTTTEDDLREAMKATRAVAKGKFYVGLEPGNPMNYYVKTDFEAVAPGHVESVYTVANLGTDSVKFMRVDNITGNMKLRDNLYITNDRIGLGGSNAQSKLHTFINGNDGVTVEGTGAAGDSYPFYKLRQNGVEVGVWYAHSNDVNLKSSIGNIDLTPAAGVVRVGGDLTAGFGRFFNTVSGQRATQFNDFTTKAQLDSASKPFIFRNALGAGASIMHFPNDSTAIGKKLILTGNVTVSETDSTITANMTGIGNTGTLGFTADGTTTAFTFVTTGIPTYTIDSKVFLTATAGMGSPIEGVDQSTESFTVHFSTAPTAGAKTLKYLVVP